MLSGLEIKKQIELGNIVISDFNESRLNPNSYNIRLGKTLKTYKKAVVPPQVIELEIQEMLAPYQEEYLELCTEYQTNEENLTEEGSKAFEEKMNDLIMRRQEAEQVAYDVILRKYALDPKVENETHTTEIPEEGYILLPGTLYLGETEEYTETYGFVPNIDGRSTTGRLGIEVHRTAGFGDNGFKGKWTLEITVTHPVIVYPGMEIGQLYYETIDGDSSMLYNGKYQNQEGVEAAKVDKK